MMAARINSFKNKNAERQVFKYGGRGSSSLNLVDELRGVELPFCFFSTERHLYKDRACGHCGTNGEVERSSLVMGGG